MQGIKKTQVSLPKPASSGDMPWKLLGAGVDAHGEPHAVRAGDKSARYTPVTRACNAKHANSGFTARAAGCVHVPRGALRAGATPECVWCRRREETEDEIVKSCQYACRNLDF